MRYGAVVIPKWPVRSLYLSEIIKDIGVENEKS